jgi:arylformamidase
MPDLAEEASWPREQLERDYNARASVSLEAFEQATGEYRRLSEAARTLPGCHFDVVYDQDSGQAVDIFNGGAGGALRPAFIFIHGGYWRALGKEDSALMAPMLARHGVATVAVDYRLAPAVPLGEIVREVRAAVAFLFKNGPKYGIDPHRLYVGGSSAGGHLSGTVLSPGWHPEFGIPLDVIKGAMPISGLFHLAPLAQTFVRDWITFDPDMVQSLSPAENLPYGEIPIVVAYAEGEPAGFKRQSAAYHQLWRDAGFSSKLVEIKGRNHFDILLDLASDESELSRLLLALIAPAP